MQMNIITKLKKFFFSSESEEEKDFKKVLTLEFTEVNKFLEKQEQQQTTFNICALELKQLIEHKDSEQAIRKLAELTQIHDKKTQNYKDIIKRQSDFHKTNNQKVVDKSKRKSQLIKEKEAAITELNQVILIYRKVEIKLADALREIKNKQKIIDHLSKSIQKSRQ